MHTEAAIVVEHPYTGRAYRVTSGDYRGITFIAERTVRTPIGTEVRVRFHPHDQYAKEI